MKQRTYIAIDLKSFYASVECRDRGLDPLDTNLVVADESRTDKTICLAVTPSLKSYGISGRGRLFEVKQRVKEANAGRQHDAPKRKLEGSSHFFSELQANPELAIDFIIAPPQMARYMEISTQIYEVYMKYVAPEDIVVYSIDEVFMDVTDYLDILSIWYRDVLLFKATNDANHLIFKEEIKYIRKEADQRSYEGIEIILDALEKAKSRLSANVNFDLTMELLFLTMKEN